MLTAPGAYDCITARMIEQAGREVRAATGPPRSVFDRDNIVDESDVSGAGRKAGAIFRTSRPGSGGKAEER